jgi:hypothetical protein
MTFSTLILLALILGFIILILYSAVGIFQANRSIRKKEEKLNQLRANKIISKDGSKFASPKVLTYENWANFERQVPNLVQVIVLADTVEQPVNGLQKAVLENFKRGVNYCFIVSSSNAESELHGFYSLFEKLAEIAIHKFKVNATTKDLVAILSLPDEWKNVPYVFYRMRDTSAGVNQIRTIAFRGDTEGKGIANRYIAVDHDSAEALVKLLMGKPPEKIETVVKSPQSDMFVDVATFPFRSEGNLQSN